MADGVVAIDVPQKNHLGVARALHSMASCDNQCHKLASDVILI